jgi:adenosylmethionine-8-amino-7-oxononanoate aminotransferase
VNTYRPPAGVRAENVAEHCANELEEEVARLGAANVAAFIFEPVVGAAGGAVPAPAGYAKRVREICDRTGILMIADEVMCGSGRCGTWRALEHDGVVPDVMSVAKGLAGGYLPLGAAILAERLWEPMMARHGGLMTGHTFSGHTAACAAGVAVQTIVEREGLLDQVKTGGAYLMGLLREALGDRPYIGDLRGRGYFIGIELVEERASKEPFPPALQLFARVRDQSFANGLICYPTGGNVDGVKGDQIILAPPYNASRAELEEIVDTLQRSLSEVMAALPKKR